MSDSWPTSDFPNLRPQDYNVTSPSTREYNCISWAIHDLENWWWPDDPEIGYAYWPPNVPRAETVMAFLLAFASVGYVQCEDADLETGFEKIALYTLNASPTHAARQLPNGRWSSKLGSYEDIEHQNLECLNGPCYGGAFIFLRRAVN
jgi:hypothetical protein